MTEGQMMTERERALLGAFGAVLQRDFPQATNSTAEVIWRTGEESKWKVSWTLSVSKSHSANVHILHRTDVPGIDERLSIFYKAINYKAVIGAPRIFANGLVVGGILDTPVPRGFIFLDKEPIWLNVVGKPAEELGGTKFESSINQALSDKKSPVLQPFSKLRGGHEYKALNMKFPKYILVAPVLGKTIIVVSSCASPSKSLNFQELVDGRTYKRELALADKKKLHQSLELYSVLSQLAKQHPADSLVNGDMMPIIKQGFLLPMLLTLEIVRQKENPEDNTELTLRELIGEAPPERLEGLISKYAEIIATQEH